MPNSPSPVVVEAGCSSVSTIAADMVTGSQELAISGYSGTKGLGVGMFISSFAFSVGGHSWCIRYYPDGMYNDDWISFYLERLGEAKDDVRARFKFSLLDHVGDAVPPHIFASDKVRSFDNSNYWGCPCFVKRKYLESSPHLKDDNFRIRCDVTVVNINVVERNTLLFHVPPAMDDLRRDFGALLANKVGADVEFKVGRETFMAHRCVLASRSSVFEAEFFGFMQETKKETDQIVIQDMDPRVFEAMLHFIYTNSLPEIDEGDTRVMAQHLLVAADRYNLQRLKMVSEDVLCKSIDPNTAATTLTLAKQHGLHHLKEACFNFLKCPGNMKAVMATDGFGHLTSSYPSI